MFRRVHDDVVCLVLSFIAAPAGKPTSMCPATLKPYKDPRRQPRVPPRVEQPQETISGRCAASRFLLLPSFLTQTHTIRERHEIVARFVFSPSLQL